LLLLQGVDASPLLFELQLEADLLVLPIFDAGILWPFRVLQFALELLNDLVLPADLVPQLPHQLRILSLVEVLVLELSLQLQVLGLELL
jgi:hypothetical protein